MAITRGYKATDKDMECRGLQFVLGKWEEVEGALVACKNGLHFCTELAHTYEFYTANDDRRFECEAEDVLEIEHQPGVVSNRVARRLRLTKEITFENSNTRGSNTGHRNTGHSNTGNWNAGHGNTGHSNTGDRNTGDRNTGHGNTGHSNTGNWNAGYRNAGDRNTGHGNTGHGNTGNWNAGYRNAGDWNTGDWNTGNWNFCNNSTGFFGSIEPKITSFDLECDYTREQFQIQFSEICEKLHELLQSDDPIDVAKFAQIPNINQSRLNKLHQKYIDSRRLSVSTLPIEPQEECGSVDTDGESW